MTVRGLWGGVLGGLRGRPVRPDDALVVARVRAAVDAVPGARGDEVGYHHQRYASGALTGVVVLDSTDLFDVVLQAATLALVEVLGADADRVTVYLSGRGPGGVEVVPGDLGTAQPPTGTELRRRYLPQG